MSINPELHRNIWLDFTFHRIIIAPLVISLFCYLFYLTGGATSSASVAFNLACLFIFIWGTKCAAETVLDEITNSTWDFQRQSSISPWEMTWGKLIGSTLFSWYGALISLFLYFSFNLHKPESLFGFHFGSSLSVSHELLLLFIGGLFTQGLALLLSLQSLNQTRNDKINRSFFYFVLAAVLGMMVTRFVFSAAKESGVTIAWHDFTFDLAPFAFWSLVIFLGWTIVGLQRSFCRELQYQNMPWVWALFNLFCIIYFSGLIPAEKIPLDLIEVGEIRDLQKQLLKAPLYFAFFIAQALTYVALFTDLLSFIRYKYFIARVNEKNYLESLQQLPWWPISLLFTVILGVMVVLSQQSATELLKDFSPSVFALTTLLFLARDIALIHYLNFAKNQKNPTGAIILYLFILYLLLPLILSALHLKSLLPMLLPSFGKNTLLAIISSVAQTGFLLWLILKRWKQNSNLAIEGVVKA